MSDLDHVPALVIKVGAVRTKDRPPLDFIEILESPGGRDADADTSELDLRPDVDPFASMMREPPPNDIVLQCGEAIFVALESLRQFKKVSLKPNDRTALYFKLDTIGSENLPWEALWHRTLRRYVALDPNWPIARLPPGLPENAQPAPIEPELKMLFVLAAAPGAGPRPVDASREWSAIWKVLDKREYEGKLRVHVLVCQDEIGRLISGLNNPRVTCEPIAEQTLENALSDIEPNIVHFFCHGSAEHGEPHISLATRSDYDACATEGRLRLGLNELAVLERTRSVWLVTLNCCEGARASARGRSLAASLAQSGVPAVVAMRQSVDFEKAGRFAGAFYEGLIGDLVSRLATEEEVARGAIKAIPETVWLNAMHRPRQLLSHTRADCDPTWTLPVVYVQRGPLRLRAQLRSGSWLFLLPPQDQARIAGLRAEGKALAEFERSRRDKGTPAAVLNELSAASARVMRHAHEEERAALVAHLERSGPPEAQREMIAAASRRPCQPFEVRARECRPLQSCCEPTPTTPSAPCPRSSFRWRAATSSALRSPRGQPCPGPCSRRNRARASLTFCTPRSGGGWSYPRQPRSCRPRSRSSSACERRPCSTTSRIGIGG